MREPSWANHQSLNTGSLYSDLLILHRTVVQQSILSGQYVSLHDLGIVYYYPWGGGVNCAMFCPLVGSPLGSIVAKFGISPLLTVLF